MGVRKSRFTDQQIVGFLKQDEAGVDFQPRRARF